MFYWSPVKEPSWHIKTRSQEQKLYFPAHYKNPGFCGIEPWWAHPLWRTGANGASGVTGTPLRNSLWLQDCTYIQAHISQAAVATHKHPYGAKCAEVDGLLHRLLEKTGSFHPQPRWCSPNTTTLTLVQPLPHNRCFWCLSAAPPGWQQLQQLCWDCCTAEPSHPEVSSLLGVG